MGVRHLLALVAALPPYSAVVRSIQRVQPGVAPETNGFAGPRRMSTPDEVNAFMKVVS